MRNNDRHMIDLAHKVDALTAERNEFVAALHALLAECTSDVVSTPVVPSLESVNAAYAALAKVTYCTHCNKLLWSAQS